MTAPVLDRDHAAVDALVADRYLDALLVAGDRRAADAPADASLDPELRSAARALRRSLVRVHPSFRFEERLAARLADLAAAQASPAVAGAIVPFGRISPPDPALQAILAGELDPAAAEPDPAAPRSAPSSLSAPAALRARSPWLVGGAVTSAAISIAGVAFVAWRTTRTARAATAGLAPSGLGSAALLSGKASGTA